MYCVVSESLLTGEFVSTTSVNDLNKRKALLKEIRISGTVKLHPQRVEGRMFRNPENRLDHLMRSYSSHETAEYQMKHAGVPLDEESS